MPPLRVSGHRATLARSGWKTAHLHLAVLGLCIIAELNDATLRQRAGAPVEKQVGGEETVAATHNVGHGTSKRHPVVAASGYQFAVNPRVVFANETPANPATYRGVLFYGGSPLVGEFGDASGLDEAWLIKRCQGVWRTHRHRHTRADATIARAADNFLERQ